MLLLVSLALLAACGGGDDAARPGIGASGGVGGTITVLAASSLTESLTSVADAFEDQHPGVQVELSFDASSRLAASIDEGVPADVFASADEVAMAQVVDAGRAQGDAVIFATNRLAIAVPAGNPGGVRELADLAGGGLRVALCRPEVPCGRYAAEAFDRAELPLPATGEEENVKSVLAKVQLGEVDAGIVYATDVQAATGVDGVELPSDVQVLARYPAVVVADAPNPDAAAALLAFLMDDDAQAILAAAGFGAP